MVVEVGNGGESCADQICGVHFIVAPFSTYSIEEFAAEGEVCNEVYWEYFSNDFLPKQNIREDRRLFIVSK